MAIHIPAPGLHADPFLSKPLDEVIYFWLPGSRACSLEMVLAGLVSKSLSGFRTTASTNCVDSFVSAFIAQAKILVTQRWSFSDGRNCVPLHSPCPQFFFLRGFFNFKQPLGGTARRPVVCCAMAVQHGEPLPTAAGTRTLQPRFELGSWSWAAAENWKPLLVVCTGEVLQAWNPKKPEFNQRYHRVPHPKCC